MKPSLHIAITLAALATSACFVADPLYCAEDKPCTDLARPFCDLAGQYEASSYVTNTCIAVPCDDLLACTGDQLTRCNAAGTATETIQCPLGCNAEGTACALCRPGETACTNGTVATCDPAGNVVSSRECALGCYQDQPRCTDIVPSNDLAQYLDMTPDAPDLDLSAGATIDTKAGTITDASGTVLDVPSFLIPTPPDGVKIRVFVARTANLGTITFTVDYVSPPPAFALVADGDVTIVGNLDLSENLQSTAMPAGSVADGPCVGSLGIYEEQDAQRTYVRGSGGGGGASQGGDGGNITYLGVGGPGGAAFVNPDLVPLRGGCRGGESGGGGGGALQLVSRTSITLADSVTINVGGGGGSFYQDATGGGGSGGGILLEAPRIEFKVGSTLVANGGGGSSGDYYGTGDDGQPSTAPAPGGTCPPNTTETCSTGGSGGVDSTPPTNAAWLTYTNRAGVQQFAGSGGGAVGYIRINTADSHYTKANNVVESPLPSTGTLPTR